MWAGGTPEADNDNCDSIADGYEPEDVTSSISTDGVLTVTAPKKALPQKSDERIVQITQTDELLSDKGSDKDKEEDEK